MKNKNEDIVRPVEADGIQEFDNQLPRWWVMLFYFCIVIGVAYGINLHFLGGQTLLEEYDEGMKQNPNSASGDSNDNGTEQLATATSPEQLTERMNDSSYIAAGKGIFTTYCAPCHGPDGGGVIGPNLTDDYFLHGHSATATVEIVANGVPAKGMVAWKPVLGQKKTEQVSAYVISLRGTTPTNPKDPQGELASE